MIKLGLERFESTLLTEFRKLASQVDAQAEAETAAIRAIRLKLGALTERVQKLEKLKLAPTNS